MCEAKRKSPYIGKLPAFARLNPTSSFQTRHPAPQPPADRLESGVCESRGEVARTGNRLRKRKNRCKSVTTTIARKNNARSDPTYTHLTRLDPTCDVQTRPTMSDLVQLLYNALKQLNGPASAEKAPITAHHTNCMNCSSDNPKTLVYTHKLSSNTQTRKPASHHQDQSD